MPGKRSTRPGDGGSSGTEPAAEQGLVFVACPNPDCCDFNRFAAGNLSVCERMGKHKHIRRLYCSSCGHRFSERAGSLLAHSKLPEETVVRIIKCLGHGVRRAASRACCTAGKSRAIRLAMMAITTNS